MKTNRKEHVIYCLNQMEMASNLSKNFENRLRDEAANEFLSKLISCLQLLKKSLYDDDDLWQ